MTYAVFYDGLTTKSHKVTVSTSESGLIIEARDGSFSHTWSSHQIRVLEKPQPPHPARLTHREQTDQRLLIDDPALWEDISRVLPKKAVPYTLPLSFGFLCGSLVLSLLFLAFLLTKAPSVFEIGVPLLPEKMMDRMGRAVVAQMGRPQCTNPEGLRALHALTQKLKNARPQERPVTVYVLDEPYHANAFATVGGHIAILSKVIEDADTPDEVAAVLAHEIAHIALKHPEEALLQQQGMSLLIQLTTGQSPTIMQTAELFNYLGALHYSREDERAADHYSLTLLDEAHIYPHAILSFYKRLPEIETKEGSDWLSYLSTHPEISERIKAVEDFPVRARSSYSPVLSAPDWAALQNICAQTNDFR